MSGRDAKLKARRQRLISGALVVAVLGLLSVLIAIQWSIRSGIDEIAATAADRYSGDQIGSLMRLVADEESSMSERNRAVWALGRLRASRALPLLEEHYTGRDCDHERFLCQRELRKAIDRCAGAGAPD